MFKATVCRSSESCGDRSTTPRKSSRAFRSSAESSVSRAPIRFATGSTLACKNGFSVTTDRMRMRSKPSTNTTRLPLGILTVLWSLAIVPTRWRSTSLGSSTRGSSCATTAKRRSSPWRELSRARELSRPTVRGKAPPGNSTVSRTGNTANSGGTTIFSVLSAIIPPDDIPALEQVSRHVALDEAIRRMGATNRQSHTKRILVCYTKQFCYAKQRHYNRPCTPAPIHPNKLINNGLPFPKLTSHVDTRGAQNLQHPRVSQGVLQAAPPPQPVKFP